MCIGEDTKTMRASGAWISKGSPFDCPEICELNTNEGRKGVSAPHLVEFILDDVGPVEKVGPCMDALPQNLRKIRSLSLY